MTTSHTTDESQYRVVSASDLEMYDIVFYSIKDDKKNPLVLRGIVHDIVQARGEAVDYDLKDSDQALPIPLIKIAFYNPATDKESVGYFNTYESFEIIRPAQIVKTRVE